MRGYKKLIICGRLSFTVFIKFPITQQITKLHDFLMESGADLPPNNSHAGFAQEDHMTHNPDTDPILMPGASIDLFSCSYSTYIMDNRIFC